MRGFCLPFALGSCLVFGGCGSAFSAGGGDGGGSGDGGHDVTSPDVASNDGTVSSDGVGTDDGPGGGDVAMPDVAVPGACPPTPPSHSQPCTGAAPQCEYGGYNDPVCNDVYTCMEHTLQQTNSANPGKCMGICPARYDLATGACTQVELPCVYTTGFCICAPPASGGGGGGLGTWTCTKATMACPPTRPMLGTTCTSPGTKCDYGGCIGGLSISCTGGYWVADMVVCSM